MKLKHLCYYGSYSFSSLAGIDGEQVMIDLRYNYARVRLTGHWATFVREAMEEGTFTVKGLIIEAVNKLDFNTMAVSPSSGHSPLTVDEHFAKAWDEVCVKRAAHQDAAEQLAKTLPGKTITVYDEQVLTLNEMHTADYVFHLTQSHTDNDKLEIHVLKDRSGLIPGGMTIDKSASSYDLRLKLFEASFPTVKRNCYGTLITDLLKPDEEVLQAAAREAYEASKEAEVKPATVSIKVKFESRPPKALGDDGPNLPHVKL